MPTSSLPPNALLLPFFLGVSLFLMPMLLSWAESSFSWSTAKTGCLRLFQAVLLVGILWIPTGWIPHAISSPLGMQKYLLGGVYVAFVFVSYGVSCAKMNRLADSKALYRFCYRGTVVFLLLLSFWIKETLVYSDEPVYLMQTASIVKNLDLALADDYRRGAYHEFLDVTMSDTTFLSSWSVDINKPPNRAMHFFGISLIMAPFYGLSKLLFLPPYLLRIVTGIPFIILVSFAIAAFSKQLGAITNRPSLALSLPMIFLLATPLHYWAQSLSPEPFLIFVMSFALLELFSPDQKQSRWTLFFLTFAIWLHPRVLYVYPLLVLLLFRKHGSKSALVGGAVSCISFSMKLAIDHFLHTGFFGGYSAARGYISENLFAAIPTFLSHWIDADSGYIFFAPLILLIPFSLPRLFSLDWNEKWKGVFIAYMSMFWFISNTQQYTNGIGRHDVSWIIAALSFAIGAISIRRSFLYVGFTIGMAWNYVFSVFPLIFSGIPSASLRTFAKIDFANIAPQFGRRISLQMPRPEWIEYAFALLWFIIILWIYHACVSPRKR